MTDEILKWMLTSIVPFILGVLWQSWRASSTEIASQINDLLKDLKQLEELSSEYWTTNHEEQKNDLRQARIRGLTFLLAGYEAQAKLIFGSSITRYIELIDELIEKSTGGSFETANRSADYARAVEVQRIISQLAELCRSARRESAGMWFATVYAAKGLSRFLASTWDLIPSLLAAPFKWVVSPIQSL